MGSDLVSETRKTTSSTNGSAKDADAPATESGPRLVTDNAGLAVDNIGKSFKKRPVLRGVTLSLPLGEAVGLPGPNGADTPTGLHTVTVLISPDQQRGIWRTSDLVLVDH